MGLPEQGERLLRVRFRVCPEAQSIQYQRNMLTGNFVIVYDQDTQILRQTDGLCFPEAALRSAELNRDREGGADTLFALYLNAAAHHLDKVLRDRHAEAASAVAVCGRRILLREGIENLGDELLVHAGARVLHAKTQGPPSVRFAVVLNGQGDAAARIREFHRVSEDVDQNLLKLHVVADIVIRCAPDDLAFIVQALVLTLPVDDDVDLVQKFAEREFLVFQNHPSGFDPAHVQNVVDKAQQVSGAGSDLFKVLARAGRKLRVPKRDVVQTDDRVHGGSNLVAHV